MTNDISATLQERGKRYGSFDGHAKVTQEIKFIINKALYDRQKTVTASMKESLDMIAHKIGRIVNGDPFYADSWIDIAGYAQLVADELDALVADAKLDAELDDRLTDGQEPVRVSLNELDAAVTVIEEEVNESHSQFGPVTDEHREWAQQILDGLASQRQGEL
jgi:hypothetical protein